MYRILHTDYIYPYMLQEDQRIQKSGVCLQATGIIKIKQIGEREYEDKKKIDKKNRIRIGVE